MNAEIRTELNTILSALTNDQIAAVEEIVRPFVTQTRDMAALALKILDQAEAVKGTCVAVARGWGDVHGVGAALGEYLETHV